MIAASIALLIGAAFGGFVGWSLGFDLGWNRGTAGMVQKARALAAAERDLATMTAVHARVCVELETIRAGRSAAGRKAWQTRKQNAEATDAAA